MSFKSGVGKHDRRFSLHLTSRLVYTTPQSRSCEGMFDDRARRHTETACETVAELLRRSHELDDRNRDLRMVSVCQRRSRRDLKR